MISAILLNHANGKMDSSEEVVIEELEVETLGVDELEVLKLLKSFELCDAVVCAFIANRYTVDILKFIERKEVEELIQQPFLAERTKCIHGINAWRKSLNLPPLAESAPSPFPPTLLAIHEPDVTRADCTATYLLQTSARGKAILTKYQTNKLLTRSDKRIITQIVVDGFKDRFSKLTASELQDRAVELSLLFPSEPQESWYQPAWTTDGSGRRVKLRKQAKGTLRDRNINYREDKVESIVQGTSQAVVTALENPASTSDITQNDLTEYQRTKKWIIHNQDDWDEVKNKWKQTTKPRLLELLDNQKRNTASILAEYPVLRHHQAYQLVQIDFQQRFPEKEKLLFDRWESFVSEVFPILEVEVTDTVGKSLLSFLKADDISNGKLKFKLNTNLHCSHVFS
ncbi:uncharacterized protein LOC135711593 [Ochlerotatus camptorhynchus]|uniref:uncharacterized protein LOC135711593 n=1 Tax=Ochlerotatus camptorhynchus TaxID=644619 RepID=UPI0031DAE718